MIESLYKFITGIVNLRGSTDNTLIGNNGNRLLTEASLEKTLVSPFGNMRVANQISIFQSLFEFDKQTQVWDETTATGGTSTWNTNTNSVDTAVTTTNASSVIRQTRRRIRYNPSRSVRIQCSGNIGGLKANVRRRVGQFDVNNGLFFELNGTTPNVVVRSNTSGSVVDTAVAQSSWNIDKLDGTGVSGLTLDFSKHQLFIIEYGWQGIACIRFGFYLNGRLVYCHEFNFANTLTVPYSKTACLPLRTEITNTAGSASATTMSFNCFVVKNEGESTDKLGTTRSFYNPTAVTVGTTVVPLLALRLNSANLSAIVEFLKASITVTTADEIIWEVRLNPTSLTGATYANNVGYLQVDTAASAITGGTVVDSGVLSQMSVPDQITSDILKEVSSQFGVSLAGASDVIVFCARAPSGGFSTADVISAITWREF